MARARSVDLFSSRRLVQRRTRLAQRRRKKFKSKKLGPKRGGKEKKLKIESRDFGRCPDWPTAGKMFHFFCCFNDEEIVVKKKKIFRLFVSAAESRDSLNGFWLAQKIKNSLNWRRHHVTALKGFSLDATRKHLNNSINNSTKPLKSQDFCHLTSHVTGCKVPYWLNYFAENYLNFNSVIWQFHSLIGRHLIWLDSRVTWSIYSNSNWSDFKSLPSFKFLSF